MNYGPNIRKIRLLLGYSQEYMALSLDMSQPNYSNLENGITPISDRRLQLIAKILNVNVEYIKAFHLLRLPGTDELMLPPPHTRLTK